MNQIQQQKLFETKPIGEAILRLALPTIIGQIILVVYNIADLFFVGMTGNDGMITAVNICMPAFMILSAISNLFGIGGAGVISRALGKQQRARARDASAFCFWGCACTTAVYALAAFFFADPFVDFLGGSDPTVHAHARRYLLCTVAYGGMGAALSTFFSHVIRAEGRSVQAGFGVALGGILNIGLDPLFMFVLLPPGQEAQGAALATAIANGLALFYFALVMVKNRKVSILSLRLSRRSFGEHIPKDVAITGLPACLMTLCENVSYAVLDHILSAWGTAVLAGIGVAKKINMLAHCMVRGMAQGTLPLIAYNYTSRDRRRARSAILLSVSFSVALAALCTALCLLFAHPFTGVFLQEGSASMDYGIRFLRILCLGAPFSACAYSFISFFQAVGRGWRSFLLAILRKGLLDIPLMFLFTRILPIFGAVWATPAADCVCCCVSLLLFVIFSRAHLRKVDGKAPISYSV